MNIIGNESHHFAQSSKEIIHSNFSSNADSSEKGNQKIRQSPQPPILKTKKIDQYLNLYPKNKEKMKQTFLSTNPEIENNNKIKQLKNTFMSVRHSSRNSFKNLYNIMSHKKNSHLYHMNKLSLGETQLLMNRRNSHQVHFFEKKNSKKNLKQIQRELQYKLLDMSIQIENENDSDDDDNNYINPEVQFKRQEKKRFTEYRNKNKNRHISFKKIQTGYNNVNNTKLQLTPTKSNPDLIKGLTTNSIYEPTKPKPKNGRRQSFMPRASLTPLANKFEKNIQPNNKRLNLSVNMNLYRNIFPHIDNELTNKDLTNINNKTVLISKNQINIKKILLYSIKNEEFENKYRLLMRQKELYDSFEDEEVIEELEDEFLFISPETYQILIFDTLILLCTLFGSFYLPFYIAQSKCFCSYIPKAIKIILFFHEFINIIDIGISFFRAYYNFEYVLIKKTERIIIHYLKKYFLLDLLSAIPFFTISYYFCHEHKEKPDGEICFYNGVDLKFNFIKMAFGFKILKLLKVLDKKVNRGINNFYEIISENYTLEKTMTMILFTIICIIGFNFFICYHIYIGLQSYPNWILKTNIQDAPFLTKYITSFYFLIATITSVGYGDITCVSLSETLYQIIILTIGVVAYSWIVSTVGNYVKKETRAAIKFNKEVSLLEEIRISYPKMSFKLYNKIYKHLETVSHQQEKLDSNLLVTSLPYTLKNQIMFIIYGSIINKFKFFKDCQNSDFILRVLTTFIPLSTKKGAFIIQEGEIIDNIVFVREGRLSLVATIDLDNPTLSIDNYLGGKFEDINEKYDTKVDNSLMDNSIDLGLKKEKVTTVLKTVLKTKEEMEEENIEQEMAKKDFNGEDIEIGNMQFLNILDILKNEHYGIVYMFLKKPSPLSLRVKSKYCQLFLLRKNDTMQISKAYPNVWKKIYYKSYHNMKSIKKMTRKVIINYCKSYGYKYHFNEFEEMDNTNHEDTEFIFKLGLVNSRKRGTNQKKIGFNLEGNNGINKKVRRPRSILKHNRNEILGINSNKSFFSGYNSFRTDNHTLTKKVSGTPKNMNINNHMALTQSRPNTNVNKNTSFFSSRNHFSSLGSDETLQPRMKQINHISNNINYNIVINDVNMNNDSKKSLLTNEENKKNSLIKRSIKSLNSVTSSGRNNIKKSNFMQNVPSKIKGLSNLQNSKNNLNYYNQNNLNNNLNIPNIENYAPIVTLNVPKVNSNINTNINSNINTNITNTNKNFDRNNTIKINNSTEEKKSEQSPNTINDLSKSLLKKVKKKIKKRRKKKKFYKMLIQKLTESMSNNMNLSSSLNNNSIVLSSKMGDVISINPEFNYNYIIDEKPELNPNISQNLNGDISQNLDHNMNPNLTHITNLNPNPFHFPQSNEMVTFANPHELFLIPESLEISSSKSSSENSSESDNASEKKEEEKKDSKLNEVPPKKEVVLSISENTNFTLNTTYENLNKISEGNYAKDENLQKSVIKLIKDYLIEKNKPEIEKKPKNSSIVEKRGSIFRSSQIKDPTKDKEEKKEKDVWSFLNDYDNNEDKEKDNLEKGRCKSPRVRQKKTNIIPKNRKSKRIYDNLFSLDETPKNKKNGSKIKRRSIKKTSIKKVIKGKKTKKKNNTNLEILKLHPVEREDDDSEKKENKENKEKENDKEKFEEKEKKDEEEKNKDKEKEKDNTIGSLEMSDLDEEIEPRESYVNNYYKTYEKKSKKQVNVKNEIKSSISEDKDESKSSKDSDNIG